MKVYLVVHGREGMGYTVRSGYHSEWAAVDAAEAYGRSLGFIVTGPGEAYNDEETEWIAVDEISVS